MSETRLAYAVYVKGLFRTDQGVNVDAWTRASVALSDPKRAVRLRDHLQRKADTEDRVTSGPPLRRKFELVVVSKELDGVLGDNLNDEALFT